MQTYDFDLFAIGAGSGGVAASRRAGSYGARVAICEELRVGGTCVLRGCVPKKLLVYGAHFREDCEDAKGFGWSIADAQLDWGMLVERKNLELDRLNGVYLRMLRDAGVKLIEGRGVIEDPHTVRVGDTRYTARYILVATGGWPVKPSVPGAELGITSNEALDLPALPRRIVIVGGGYIGVEFAGIFHAAGVSVTLLVRGPAILGGFDGDIRAALTEELRNKDIDIRTRTSVRRVDRDGEGYRALCESGESLSADRVMFATGRAPNTRGLGLCEAGVTLNAKGAVIVDDWSATSVPSIYAVGDVTDRLNLTPVAIAEGRAFVETNFNRRPMKMDRDLVPSAVFSQPPAATVGLPEEEARQRHAAIDIYRTRFRPMKHTLSGRQERVMMKIVVDRETDRVLGCHMVGADAPEIIQGMAIALRCGLTKSQLDTTLGIHPTLAEEFVTMREPVR